MLLIADALADWLCYGMGVYSKHAYVLVFLDSLNAFSFHLSAQPSLLFAH